MDITASVQRLLNSKAHVIERFYDRLFTRHPELRRHFVHRNIRMQASMLTMALASVEAYYTHRFPATEHYLKVLGHRHYHEGVVADDFIKFQNVMLEILAEFFDAEWTPELAAQWQSALELAIETMRAGYSDTYTL